MSAARTPPLALICGEDEFAVKQRARQLYQQWCDELGGMDHEIIEATVSNSGEALAALARLREALQTLPFFGSGKVIWLRDCSFLGDERAASAQAVTETLTGLAEELKAFSWQGVRLLISAGKVDKRKTFFKTLDKIGSVESFSGWSVDDKDWANRAPPPTNPRPAAAATAADRGRPARRPAQTPAPSCCACRSPRHPRLRSFCARRRRAKVFRSRCQAGARSGRHG